MLIVPLLCAVRAQAQETKLVPSDGAGSDLFGRAVSISDDGGYALVGAAQHDVPSFLSGAAYVFVRDGSDWTEQSMLFALDAAAGDRFGESVALSGDGVYALVGATGDDDTEFISGSAYVFVRDGTAWSQQDKLNAEDPGDADQLGMSVALNGDGTVALVGAWLDDDNGDDAGSAYVFTRIGEAWAQEAKLLATDGAAGDWFGTGVSLSADGNYALVAAYFDDDDGENSGSVYVFHRDGGAWTEQAKLVADDAAALDNFGFGVQLSGNGEVAVVGAWLDDDDGDRSGAAYLFTRSGTAWTQQSKLTADDAAAGDQFGYSVSINGSGTVVLVGANTDSDAGSESGSMYVFTRDGAMWAQAEKYTASDGAASDYFGRSVALSRNAGYGLVGADGDDDNGDDSGSAYVFASLPTNTSAGAAGAAAGAAARAGELRLDPPYPNPTRGEAVIRFGLADGGTARVAVYDLLGREVAEVWSGHASAGDSQVVFDATDLASGVYMIRLEAGGRMRVRMLVR